MSKMCSLSRSMRGTDGEAYVNLMSNAKYYCKRCGRVANEREYLCRPYPMTNEDKNDIKVKEVDIAVTRHGIEKHYVLEKQGVSDMNEEKIENVSNPNPNETEHVCNCTPEDNCGDNCSCKDNNVVHVSELFKDEDGSFSDEWILENDSDEISAKEDDSEPFIKNFHKSSGKKDKKIKKMKISELKAIIREEVKKALNEKN